MSHEPFSPGLEDEEGDAASACGSVVINLHEPHDPCVVHISAEDHDPYAHHFSDDHTYSDCGSGTNTVPSPRMPASPLYSGDWQHRRSATAEHHPRRQHHVHDRSRTADLSPQGHTASVNPLGRGWWLSSLRDRSQQIDSHILEEMIERAHAKPGDMEEEREGTQHSLSPGNSPRRSEAGAMDAASNHSSEDDCAMCLCPLEEGVCTITPCNHKFHTECMFEFFTKCSVKSCIMCRGEVETLVKDDGTVVTHAELKRLFRVECYGMRFRRTPWQGDGPEVTSFFTVPSHVRGLPCAATDEGSRKVTIPTVVLELVDSDGNLSTNHGDVFCSVLHSSATGTISPDSVMFSNGVAVFTQLECEYKPDKSRPNLLAIKFQVECPNAMAHHKAVYAGVRTKITTTNDRTRKILIAVVIVLILLVVTSLAVFFA
eukprot:TRINITY_DN10545_c0_g2_i1.p1 TRINITY_DN10545_c0_g2~~TRINITY_DN10545_c0_g2_i1.p1  ORF type:complete len:444 (+),score=112.39 TRINITY_DN10545_c0_g2_i1:46-1332(+)